MAGRYLPFSLFPLDLKELASKGAARQETLEALLRVSGFPEPFLAGSEGAYKRWRRTHLDIILRQDLVETESLRRLADLETLVELMRERAGGLLSYVSLREDLRTDDKTIKRWLGLLESSFLPSRRPGRGVVAALPAQQGRRGGGFRALPGRQARHSRRMQTLRGSRVSEPEKFSRGPRRKRESLAGGQGAQTALRGLGGHPRPTRKRLAVHAGGSLQRSRSVAKQGLRTIDAAEADVWGRVTLWHELRAVDADIFIAPEVAASPIDGRGICRIHVR